MYLETIVQEFSDVVDNSIEPLLKAPSHCVKNVRIRSNSGPYFPAFGLNTERYSVSLRIQSECGKIRTRITPNRDTFYGVLSINLLSKKITNNESFHFSPTDHERILKEVINLDNKNMKLLKTFLLTAS